MIALLNDGYYFMGGCKNINELLISYAEYTGAIDPKIFGILANSNKMSTEELIDYINDTVYSYNDKIMEIYEVGENIYG